MVPNPGQVIKREDVSNYMLISLTVGTLLEPRMRWYGPLGEANCSPFETGRAYRSALSYA